MCAWLVAGVAVASALVTGIGAAPAPAAPAPVDWGPANTAHRRVHLWNARRAHGSRRSVGGHRHPPSPGCPPPPTTAFGARSSTTLAGRPRPVALRCGESGRSGRRRPRALGSRGLGSAWYRWNTTLALRGCRAVGLSGLDLPATGAVDWDAALARARALVGARNAACLHANPLLGRHAGSVDAADDVDAIRAALHDDQAGYWGLSYGTTIGYTLALRHPEQLSRLYLDSTVNPSAGLGAVLDSFSWAIGPSLTFLSQASPRAFATWQSDVTTLSSGAIALPGGRRMTRWDAYLLLKLDPTVAGAALIHAAVSGDAKAGAVVAQSLEAVDAIGLWGGLRSLIICTDHPERPAAPAGRALLARSGRMAGDMGKMLAVGTAAMCAACHVNSASRCRCSVPRVRGARPHRGQHG
jgi:pimeloyl-ACP methyl ester carboxylesterase